MKRKIYIASSWKNEEYVLILAKVFRDNGLEVYCFAELGQGQHVFMWPDVVGPNDDGITCLENPHSLRAYKCDKAALDSASTCVLVLPSGRDSHMEAGYIKGRGGQLFILGQFPKGEFSNMYHLADGLFKIGEHSNGLKKLLAELSKR